MISQMAAIAQQHRKKVVNTVADLTPMICLGHNPCWIVLVADVRQIKGGGVPCMVVNDLPVPTPQHQSVVCLDPNNLQNGGACTTVQRVRSSALHTHKVSRPVLFGLRPVRYTSSLRVLEAVPGLRRCEVSHSHWNFLLKQFCPFSYTQHPCTFIIQAEFTQLSQPAGQTPAQQWLSPKA